MMLNLKKILTTFLKQVQLTLILHLFLIVQDIFYLYIYDDLETQYHLRKVDTFQDEALFHRLTVTRKLQISVKNEIQC